MRKTLIVAAGAMVVAPPALADKYYGAFVNAASGASLPAAFEIVDDDTLSYCFNDVETNCFELPYVTLEGGVIQAHFSKDTTDDGGNTDVQTNLWTWTPTQAGYDGVFAIRYNDDPPQVQTTGDFAPRE